MLCWCSALPLLIFSAVAHSATIHQVVPFLVLASVNQTLKLRLLSCRRGLEVLKIFGKSDASAAIAEVEVQAKQVTDVSNSCNAPVNLPHPPDVERPGGVDAAVPGQRDAQGRR